MGRRKRGLRRAAVGATVAILGGGAAWVAAAPTAHADTTPTPAWARTATAAAPTAGTTALGAAPAGAPVPVVVGLRPRDQAGLDQLLAAQVDPKSPEYHRYLTPAAYTARFGATTAQADAVVDYLRSEGMTDVQVGATRLSVTADATTASAARAFATRFEEVRRQGRTGVANTAPALIPGRLSATVASVVGLDQTDVAHTDHQTLRALTADPATTAATGAASGVTSHEPDQFPAIYDASSLPEASGTTVAIMAQGDLTPVVNDLRTAENAFSLPVVPVTVEQTGAASSDTSEMVEWDLDSQSVTAMAGTVSQLYLYDAPTLDDADVTTEISRWVSDDKATVASASYGICDSDARADGTAAAVDNALAEAQVQGQAFFAASGDSGSTCETYNNATTIQPSYPASSTWATGVGGTTLSTNGTTWAGETVWNDGSGASGGGKSSETRPSYANDAQEADTADALGSSRGEPDMAMDGNPSSGADIVVQGSLELIGGTSLSSPLAAGAWARLETAHSDALGDAAADLYTVYGQQLGTTAGAAPGMHDVTSGNNALGGYPGYSAHVGYDLTTGLGTFDAAAVSAELDVAPSFTADSPPGATVSQAYGYRFAASGLPVPSYVVTAGSLPPGLSLNSSTGALSGVPTLAGTYRFVVTAANGVAPNATSPALSVTVGDPSGAGDAVFQGSTGNLKLAKPIVGMAVDPATGGYWLVASDGGVFSFNAPFFGSTGNLALAKPIVGMAATPDGGGYYLVASDGGIFAFGDARFHGSTGNLALVKPVVGMAVDPATGGYWLDASDGGIFAFDAPFYGSAGNLRLVKPVVGMAATPTGGGYYLDASDGGIFSYGNAPFQGSAGALHLAKPAVGMAIDPVTGGYWLDASDGGIFAFNAPFYGSAGALRLAQPVVGMAATPTGRGYYLVAADGGIFTY